MLKIGLTGGIGSGKTTVSDQFAELGVPVLDTDIIARQVVVPGSAVLAALVAEFGEDITNPDGSLDRAKMRERIFGDDAARATLEQIIHPAIKTALRAEMAKLDNPYCILVIPLLLEKSWQDVVDRVLVVDAPDNLRMERVKQRNKLNEQQIKAIMDSQAPREARLMEADDVIVNDSNLQQVRQEVERLHSVYRQLAKCLA